MHKTCSLTNITEYLDTHYLTREQLAIRANISLAEIDALIENSCLPQHSHKHTAQSFFHTEIFGDTVGPTREIHYYHPSLVKWAITAHDYAKKLNLNEVATKIKTDFIRDLRQALVEVDDARTIFHYCFDNDGRLLEAGIDKVMAEHWPHVLNGTYGVCLKKITARNIIMKTITVAALEKWIKAGEPLLELDQQQKMSKIAELYDNIAACFGPHEINKCTRGRLFNKYRNSQLANVS